MNGLKRKIIALTLVLSMSLGFGSIYALADNESSLETSIYELDMNADAASQESQETNVLEEVVGEVEEEVVEEPSDELDTLAQTEIQAEEILQAGANTNYVLFAAPRTVTYDKNFDDSVLPASPGLGQNEWQIMRGSYIGPYNKTDVSEGFDAQANVSYSSDDAVRLTKNVISTDVENQFLMYLNIEPQVSWEDILQLNKIKVSNNNRPLGPGDWPAGGQNSAYFVPESTGKYTTAVKFRYYAIENGNKIILAEVIMYTDVNKVPNGGIGIGNPLLAPDGSAFYSANNFDLDTKGNGPPVAEIDISSLYNKYQFSIQKVYPKTVRDQVGDHIEVDASSFNYDGGSCSLVGNVIQWTLPDKDLGLLPYTIDAEGNVTPSGVMRKLENGKYTYYRQEAYQLTYRFSLKVQDGDFISAGSAESDNSITQAYAVQTNKSPDDAGNIEKGGEVTYSVGGQMGTGDFKSPYIKGLLYDLEFKKVVEDSDVPLGGVTFKIEAVGSCEDPTIEKTEVTDEEGWVKFHNLPWGEYKITEVSLDPNDSFQQNYLDETLPKEIRTVAIGEVINADGLRDDHSSGHSVDYETDERNQLFLLNPDKDGKVENKPYRAKIRIQKQVNYYDNLSSELKSTEYEMKTESEDIYPRPKPTDQTLSFLNKDESVKHQETLTYDLIVPRSGGQISLEELIPDAVSDKIVFKKVIVKANDGSTDLGTWTMTENQGCSIEVLPGNDITVIVENNPVGTIQIRKEIDNYQSALSKDTFIIQADSVSGTEVHGETVLSHGEISPAIKITDVTSVDIREVVPKEYTLSGMSISGGGTLNGNRVMLEPGEHVVVTVHNQYEWKPYFHVSDAVKNIFKRN